MNNLGFYNATIIKPKCYNFTPQDDITALESAWLAIFLKEYDRLPFGGYAEDLRSWPFVSRHFTEVPE